MDPEIQLLAAQQEAGFDVTLPLSIFGEAGAAYRELCDDVARAIKSKSLGPFLTPAADYVPTKKAGGRGRGSHRDPELGAPRGRSRDEEDRTDREGKRAKGDPDMESYSQEARNGVMAAYLVALLSGDNLVNRPISASTAKRYVDALLQSTKAVPPLKVRIPDPTIAPDGSTAEAYDSVLAEQQRWEEMPNRREPLTKAMVAHLSTSTTAPSAKAFRFSASTYNDHVSSTCARHLYDASSRSIYIIVTVYMYLRFCLPSFFLSLTLTFRFSY